MPDTVSKGIHENVYQVELGSNARVLNIETNTIESIDKVPNYNIRGNNRICLKIL